MSVTVRSEVPLAATPPSPRPGVAPMVSSLRRGRMCSKGDCVAPRARPPLGAPPGVRPVVDGTPEVALAGAALGGLGLVAGGVTLAEAAASFRVAGSVGAYGSSLARAIGHSLSDPAKTGEHIAEGVVGGAAWAAAAASVAALADAARAHLTAPRP